MGSFGCRITQTERHHITDPQFFFFAIVIQLEFTWLFSGVEEDAGKEGKK